MRPYSVLSCIPEYDVHDILSLFSSRNSREVIEYDYDEEEEEEEDEEEVEGANGDDESDQDWSPSLGVHDSPLVKAWVNKAKSFSVAGRFWGVRNLSTARKDTS